MQPRAAKFPSASSTSPRSGCRAAPRLSWSTAFVSAGICSAPGAPPLRTLHSSSARSAPGCSRSSACSILLVAIPFARLAALIPESGGPVAYVAAFGPAASFQARLALLSRASHRARRQRQRLRHLCRRLVAAAGRRRRPRVHDRGAGRPRSPGQYRRRAARDPAARRPHPRQGAAAGRRSRSGALVVAGGPVRRRRRCRRSPGSRRPPSSSSTPSSASRTASSRPARRATPADHSARAGRHDRRDRRALFPRPARLRRGDAGRARRRTRRSPRFAGTSLGPAGPILLAGDHRDGLGRRQCAAAP